MKIHLTTGVEGNFGDQLNAWLWHDLYPRLFDADEPDGVNFIGIGSMLDERLPARGLNVVMGTGTGRARAPNVHDEAATRWRIYGVRGPLTARLMGLPDDTVLTDPAVLLARHPRWQRRAAGSGTTLFVPHWKSVRYGQWPAACALAGIEFVDPRGDARALIDRIAQARLVVAESMHAAIIADALRVPWIPVVLSREVAPFRWTDWAATVGVEYLPLLLAPSSPLEQLRGRVLAHSSLAHIGPYRDQAQRSGGPRELAWTRQQLLADHAAASLRAAQPWRRRASVVADALLRRAAQFAAGPHEHAAPGRYRRLREQAAEQLHQVLASPQRLSSDGAHRRAVLRCEDAVGRLQADCRAGRFAAWRPAEPSLPLGPGRLLASDFAIPVGERS